MEIKLKSELFKEIFKDEIIVVEELSGEVRLDISEDVKVPKINGNKAREDIFEDYRNILEAGINVLGIAFCNLPSELIREIFKIGCHSKIMKVLDSEFDFSILDDVDSSQFEHIEDLQFSGLKSKDGTKSRFKHASNLKELRYLNLFGCECLDVDSLLDDIPFPEKLDTLWISSNLPTSGQMKRFNNIKSLYIQNVDDPNKLFNFLESVSLETLTVISIKNCNLENMPESLIARLSSLLVLNLINNENTDYNKILNAIPNKVSLKNISLHDVKDNNFNIDISNLERFIKLKRLDLSKLKFDFDRLGVYLERDTDLKSLIISDCNVENLDFLDNARRSVEVDISQDDIDFKLLTPQIARKHEMLSLRRRTTNESIETSYKGKNEYDLKPTLDLGMNIRAESLEELKSIIADADEMSDVDIEVSHDISVVEDIFLRHIDKVKSNYSVTVSSFSQMTEERVDRLSRTRKLDSIKVIDKECNDEFISKRFTYTTEQYLELKKKVQEITGDIPRDLPELQKFMIIYRRLGAKIAYDYGIVGKHKYSKYAKDNVDNSRNCVNGLIRNTCVCAGYADILYNCLREVGIEAYKVFGVAGDYHQWNKVKIDGKFYNTDLTWDVPELVKNDDTRFLTWCLRGDDFFEKSHNATFGKSDKCLEDFDKKQIKEALRFAMEFDGIKPKNRVLVVFEEIKDELKSVWNDVFRSKKKALPEPSKENADTSGLSSQTFSTAVSPLNKANDSRASWDLGAKKAEVQSLMLNTYNNDGESVNKDYEQSKER